MINWRRVLSIMRKEWWHITRDRMSFILLLISPVLVLITMGYAFSIDITDVGIGVLDQDLSPLSRQYVAQLRSTDALRLEAWPENLEDVDRLMMRGTVKAVVIIPKGFARDMQAGDMAALQVIVDGTDPNTAGHAIQHWAPIRRTSRPSSCRRNCSERAMGEVWSRPSICACAPGITPHCVTPCP